MTVEPLLPCPFCGEADRLDPVGDGVTEWVVCRQCGCDGPVARSAERRIAAWNGRPPLAIGSYLYHAAWSALRLARSRNAISAEDEETILAFLSGHRAPRGPGRYATIDAIARVRAATEATR